MNTRMAVAAEGGTLPFRGDMMRVKLVAALSSASLLAGCATSNVAQFYQPVPHRSATAPVNVDPEFKRSSGNMVEDVASEATNGYELVGYSAFNGPEASKIAENAQAKQVGATIVIYGAKYVETVNTGAIGSTTFTKYGAFSLAIPTSVRKYDQISLFFVKAPRIGLGTYMQALKSEEHAKIGTNKGMRIMATVKGSPAFNADVLPGDILLAINDKPVFDGDSLHSAAEAAYGSQAKLSLLRDGQPVEKTVALPCWWGLVGKSLRILPSRPQQPS
jgi:hypothetical protein